MGVRGKRPTRPEAASSPSIRKQDPQLPSSVGKLSQNMNNNRPKKKGLLPPRKSAASPTP